MEYQVTARKWRPQSFEEVIGQEHVTRALKNAFGSGKIPHAFLFSGPRGVGKTTTARVLAKALNCQNGPTANPCNQCASCKGIVNGSSMDVLEIDGASNRGIDNIREIRDNSAYMPLASRYKIFIIDEVHMLTVEASNALLKTLEEPPEHVVFILATTESHKVLPTIRSRCQHYLFKKISSATIVTQLTHIAKNESIKTSEEALYRIASTADGSMRDAESIFDQVVLYSDSQVTDEAVTEVLGIPKDEYFFEIMGAVTASDTVGLLQAYHTYMENIGDLKMLTKGLIDFLRLGMLALNLPKEHEMLDMSPTTYQKIKTFFTALNTEEIVRLINILVDTYSHLKGDANERFIMEMALFKMLDYKNMLPMSELRKMMEKISPATVAHNEPLRSSPVVSNLAQNVVQSVAPAQTAYVKVNTPLQKPASEEIRTESGEAGLKQVLSSTPMWSAIGRGIVSVETDQNSLKANMRDRSIAESFVAFKSEIEKALQTSAKKEWKISVFFNDEPVAQKEAPAKPEKPKENAADKKTVADILAFDFESTVQK